MLFPNKITKFQESTISKLIFILDELSSKPLGIVPLYTKLMKHFEDLDQFILALDVLFLLEKIRFDEKWEVLIYVKKDTMY
ncbi:MULTISPECIES: ABC-three component system middle component 7 [unclassified Enterococcus]|jgi:hypothetical protein|uniref:ABC-three component system middle component 7 n=1 Tax=unclassified Enterococcus TaxID=2608891 RepID=UPI003D2B4EB0